MNFGEVEELRSQGVKELRSQEEIAFLPEALSTCPLVNSSTKKLINSKTQNIQCENSFTLYIFGYPFP